jgi:serine/threonine-protein kinase RsbT
MRSITSATGTGVEIQSRDRGPGMLARQPGAGEALTGRAGLGAGLASVRRLMDDFDLRTARSGTSIVCRKWRRTH